MMDAFLCFYGTRTALVRAPDADAAYEAFLDGLAPPGRRAHPSYGRMMPPARDEVQIRRPTEADRAWIADSGDPSWLALLNEMEPA